MKKKIIPLLVLSSFLLTGCFFIFPERSSQNGSKEELSSEISSASSEENSSSSKTTSNENSSITSSEISSDDSSYSEYSSEDYSSSTDSSSEHKDTSSYSENSSEDYSSNSEYSSEETYSSYIDDSSEQSSDSSEQYSSDYYSEDTSSEYYSEDASSENPSSEQTSSEKKTGTVKIEIYGTNDIHGQVYPDSSENNSAGIGNLATYLKEKKALGNTLLIDQGDTWQGSIYSNHNHGELITDIMNYIHYDARTVGNHDFDWGTTYIEKNTAKSYLGYSTPVLAGNVYDFDWSTNTTGTTQQSNLGVESVTYDVGGVKVGILGCIGKDQLTSITSSYTTEINFTDHVEFIKSEATHLRNDEHCDVVICSVHAGQEDVLGNSLQNYVDLVLCGHTHTQETTNEGDLYYVQSRAYTLSISHTTLTYSFDLEKVTDTEVEFINGSSVKFNVTTIDPTISDLMEAYKLECDSEANVVVANAVSGSFSQTNQAPNIMSRAIMDYATKKGFNIDVACVNKSRSNLPAGQWTYANLYQAFPFDNEVYIAEITGKEFMKEVAQGSSKFTYICKNSSFTTTTIDLNATYRIAVLDFQYLHINMNSKGERYYDYFAQTGGSSTQKLDKNYREILKYWLMSNGYDNGKTLNYYEYSNTVDAHDATVYTSN